MASYQTMPITLVAKLGSIAAHAEEMLSTDGHAFDAFALRSLLGDAEVITWLRANRALLPVKRTPTPAVPHNKAGER